MFPSALWRRCFKKETTDKWSQNCWNYSFSPGTHFDFTSGTIKSSWSFSPCRWHQSISSLSLILPLQPFKRPQSVFTFCLEFYLLSLPPKSYNIHCGISNLPWIVLLPQPFINTFYSFVLPTQVCHFLFTLLVGKL